MIVPERVMNPARAAAACLRAERFMPRDNPAGSAFSHLLVAAGFVPETFPVWGVLTRDRWLMARVAVDGLLIEYRHPDSELLLVSRIVRADPGERTLRSPMGGLIRFLFHATRPESGLTAILASIDPDEPDGSYPAAHASRFFEQTVGWMEKIPMKGRIWYVGDPHDSRRWLDRGIWARIAPTPAA